MIAKTLEKELNLEPWQVNKVIKLIDDGTLFLLLQDTERMLPAL